MKSTLRLAAFLAAAALTVLLQAQSLVVYDANTPAENLRSLGNAKFQQTPDGLLIETQGSQAQGKEVFPGVAVVGDWDLTEFNTVEVVAGHRDHKSMFNLTIRLAAGENNLGGQSNAYIADTGVSTEPGFCTVLVPIDRKRFQTTGIRRTPWDGGGKCCTLVGNKITSVGIYMNRPLLDWKWTVKSITLKKVDRGQLAKVTQESGIKPFRAPTQAEYYAYFDPNPVWENMTEEEFFPFIDVYGQFKYKDWPGKIHSDAELQTVREAEEKDLAAHPGPKGWDEFGGWADGPKQEATGQFYVKKIDGKWWMVDPLGNLYWSHGPVRVTSSSAVTPLDGREHYFENLPDENSDLGLFYTTHDELLWPYYTKRNIQKTYDFSSANAFRKYGKDWRNVYADLAHRRLRSWGMNTIANSSDVAICKMDRTPYTDRIELKSPSIAASHDGWWPFRDPFDPEFRANFHRQLLERKAELDDPWCFGFFVDNELSWGTENSLGYWTLQSPATQCAKVEFVKRLTEKYGTIEKLNEAWGTSYASWDALLQSTANPGAKAVNDCKDFACAIVEEYYKNVRDEFKKVAPNKLYLGCRFAGGTNETFLRIGAKYCDVLSYNIYRFTVDSFKLPEGVDKPILVGEFHFGALDRGVFHWTLIGVKDQKERGQAYFNYVKSALEHPNFIGVHWHQYSEQPTTGRFDGECFQNGFVDVCDTPYVETIEKIREIGYQMYDVRWNKK